MIRFFLTLLMIHFSLSLISCSSTSTEPTTDNTTAAIDEAAAGGAVDEGGAAAAPAAPGKTGGEDDLESELAGNDKAAAAAPEKPLEQAPAVSDDDLEKDLKTEDTKDQALEPAPGPEGTTPPPIAAAPVSEKAKVTDIRYMANANGGTVVIETTKPVTYQSRMNPATQQFVIEIADVELPPALQRPYNMKEFGSRFGSINAYQGAGSSTARVVIQMNGPSTVEPIVQQEGTSLVVIPPAVPPPTVAQTPPLTAPAKEEKSAAAREGALAAKSLSEFLSGNQKFYGRAISLQVKDADIRDVVNFLAEESGANVVMSEDVAGKISLKLRKIPWDQALVTVMRSRGLGYVRQGNVLRISTMATLQKEAEAGNKLIETQKIGSPNIVQVIPISYASMEEIQKAIAPFLTDKVGKSVVDTRSSTLIVTDKSEAIDRVLKLVKTLDIPPAQVSIESKIVEAVEGFESFAGINWSISGSPVHISNKGAYGAPVDLLAGLNSGSLSQDFTGATPFNAHMSIGTLDVLGNLTAALTLAESDSLAKVISAPRISAMNREKSTIVQQGENVSVIATRSEQTGLITKNEKRTPFKLELSVTPQITADGGVIMDLDVQREFLGPVVDAELGSRAVNSRKAHTKVLVRNGQTAVIGGIYTTDELEATTGVPGLKDIPILGWLFKNRSFSRDKTELLIFMTPRILTPESATGEQAAN